MRTRFASVVVAALALIGIAPFAHAADVEEERSRFRSFEGSGTEGKVIFDFEVLREIREQLGDSANVILIVSSCHSGGFATFAPDWLLGNFSASASRKMTSNVRKDWHEQNWFNEIEKRNTKTGIKINDEEYGHGWFPQVIRAIKLDKDRTVKDIHDFAKANDYEGSNGPQYTKGGTGDALKLRPAAGKSRAIYWHTACDKNDMIKTGYTTLKDAGFLAAEIQLAYNDGGNITGAPVDHAASKDALLGNNGMIKWLKTQLAGGAGARHAVIILSSRRGDVEKAKVPKAPAAVPDTRKQGRVITPGDSAVTITVNDEFIEGFFAGLRPGPETTVGVNPSIMLTTSEETYSGPVSVTIDGQSVGSFSMLGTAAGHTYELLLSSAAWSALDVSGVLDDGVLGLSFGFPSGSFRVATEWDFDLDHLDHYGVGLATPSVGSEGSDNIPPVPAAAPIGIALLAALTLMAGTLVLRGARAGGESLPRS